MSKAINRKTIKLNLSEEDRTYMAQLKEDLGLESFAEVQKHLLEQHRTFVKKTNGLDQTG